MSYKSVREILNAVFDSDDGVLNTAFKDEGEVLNLVLDESGEPSLKVRMDGMPTGSSDAYTKAETDALLTPKADKTALRADNLLINSCGRINQRGYVSGTATTTANQYTLDRWRVVASGQNLVFSVSGGIKTFTAPAGGVEQVIENINVQGGEYALSYTGTATVQVAQSADNISYSTVTPADGKYSINAGYYVRIRFSGGTFSKPKLERGQTATEWNLRNYSEELENCQRYCYVSKTGKPYLILGFSVAYGTTTCMAVINLPRNLRTAPSSLTFYGNWSLYENTSGLSKTVSAMSLYTNGTSTDAVWVTVTSSGLTRGDLYTFQANNDANAYVSVETEL